MICITLIARGLRPEVMTKIKKKRLSKNSKPSWRKVNIDDVEDYLDLQRQEERIGSFAKKKDDDLFRIDVKSKFATRPQLTQKQRRKLNAMKPMRSWDPIKNKSDIKDPIHKRNKVNQRQNKNIRPPAEEGSQPENVSIKECIRLENFNRDMWVEKDFRDKLPFLKDENGWISEELALHVINNMGSKIVRVHDSLRHRTTKAK